MSRFSDPTARLDAARRLLVETPANVTLDPDALAAFLRFRACFRAFSLANTLLIFAQRPRARFCMGFRQWLAHGRQVRKGEHGLMIYVPRFARRDDAQAEAVPSAQGPGATLVPSSFLVGYVFDLEQTEVTPGREADALRYCSPLPVLTGAAHAPLYAKLCAAANAAGWRVVEEEAISVDGYCDTTVRRLVVRATLDVDARCAVLAHEFAHALAHTGEGVRGKSHAVRELEAEGAAFLACAALGLDTARMSLPYLYGYADDGAGRSPATYLAAIDALAARIVVAVESAPEVLEFVGEPRLPYTARPSRPGAVRAVARSVRAARVVAPEQGRGLACPFL